MRQSPSWGAARLSRSPCPHRMGAGQLPAGADRPQRHWPHARLQLPNRLLGRSPWLQEVSQISGINYLLDMSLSLLLSSLRETNFVRLKAAWMSLQMTCSVSRRKPVKDSLGGFCSSLSPVPQKHLSSPVHERLVFALNQTQMFTTHFRRKRVGSQHPSFCPPALPLLCTRTNLFSRSTILFFSSSEKCYSCTLMFWVLWIKVSIDEIHIAVRTENMKHTAITLGPCNFVYHRKNKLTIFRKQPFLYFICQEFLIWISEKKLSSTFRHSCDEGIYQVHDKQAHFLYSIFKFLQ